MPTRQTAVQQTKQKATQQQVVKVQIGEMPKKKRRTRKRKATKKTSYMPPIQMPPTYQPLFPSFTPSIPTYQAPSLPPPPPMPEAGAIKIKAPEKPEPERPVPRPRAERPAPEPPVGLLRGLGRGVLAGLATFGEPRPITQMPVAEPVLPEPPRMPRLQEQPQASSVVSIEPTPEMRRQEEVPAPPRRRMTEVRTATGQVQLQEMVEPLGEPLPPAEPPAPPRKPTEEERAMMREARLRAMEQPIPVAAPSRPAPVSAPPTLNINSFTDAMLRRAYKDILEVSGPEAKIERYGKKGKPTKKELYDYFEMMGMLNDVYQEYR